jgi:hypothetical protein
MLRADFGEKCIIVHFLGMEKDRKRLSTQRAQRRRERGSKLRPGTISARGCHEICRQGAADATQNGAARIVCATFP